jgi:Mn-dependent DtxR family transcriptional regulator
MVFTTKNTKYVTTIDTIERHKNKIKKNTIEKYLTVFKISNQKAFLLIAIIN